MEEQFRELQRQSGQIPPALAAKPEVDEGFPTVAHICFLDCQTDRPSGLSVGAIPFTSVARWCEVHRITEADEIDEIWSIVHKADVMLVTSLTKKEIGKPGGGAVVGSDYVKMRRAMRKGK